MNPDFSCSMDGTTLFTHHAETSSQLGHVVPFGNIRPLCNHLWRYMQRLSSAPFTMASVDGSTWHSAATAKPQHRARIWANWRAQFEPEKSSRWTRSYFECRERCLRVALLYNQIWAAVLTQPLFRGSDDLITE